MQRKASRQAVSPDRRATSSRSDAKLRTAKPARAKPAPEAPAKRPSPEAGKASARKAATQRPARAAAPAKPARQAAPVAKPARKAAPVAKPARKAAAKPGSTGKPATPKTRARTRVLKAAPRPSAAPVLPVRPAPRAVPALPPPPPLDRSSGARTGLRELDWSGFSAIARELVAKIRGPFRPDLVVGLAKGGVFVGEELARALSRPFLAVQLGKRSRDGGRRTGGAMPDDLLDRRVLVVDDIAGTGEALEAAAELAHAAGAREVRTAALVARPGGYRPDFALLETDDVVVLPWDYEPPTGSVGTTAGAGD